MVWACASDKSSIRAMWFDCFGAGMHFCVDPSLSPRAKLASAQWGGDGETDKEMHPNYCLFPCNFISPACNLPLGSLKIGTLNMILICEHHFYPARLQKTDTSTNLRWRMPFHVVWWWILIFVRVSQISRWWNFPMLSMATKDEGSGMAPSLSSSITFPPFCRLQYRSKGCLGC